MRETDREGEHMARKVEIREERRGDDTYWWEVSVWVAIGSRLAITGTCKVWEVAAQEAAASKQLLSFIVAKASCGPSYSIDKLSPSDNADGDKPHKVNPRRRCGRCRNIELAKRRRT